MKKAAITVAAIVAALIVAGLLGPWYTGRTTNQQLDAAVAAINRQGTLQASYARTRTGWFGQQGDLVLVPMLASLRKFDPHGTRPLQLHLDIAYGPFPFAAWRHGFTVLPEAAVINARINGLHQALTALGSDYVLRDVIGLTGNNHLRAQLDAGQHADADGTHLQWAGSRFELDQHGARWSGTGHSGQIDLGKSGAVAATARIAPLRIKFRDLEIRDGMSAGKIDMTWNGLQASFTNHLTGALQNITVGKLALSGDTHFVQGVAADKSTMTLASVRYAAAGNDVPFFDLENMSLTGTTTDPRGDYLDSRLRWRIARLSAAGKVFAPLSLDLDFAHINVPALRNLMLALRRMGKLQQQNLPPQVVSQNIRAAILPPMLDLLQHQPVLRLQQLSIGSAQGALQAQGSARLPLPPNAQVSPPALMHALDAQFSLRVAAPFAQRLATYRLASQGTPADQQAAGAQQLLARLLSHGILLQQGANYALNFSDRGGAMQLNGHALGQH